MSAERETMEYAQAMRRMLAGWVTRLADADLEDVSELADFAEVELPEALRQVVAAMREDGRSWADVGRAFGITRQAAYQRFGVVASAP